MRAEKRKVMFPLNLLGSKARVEYQPLGTVGCISPWNFPLAIFIGQVAAALATGNTVLAKPAPQTPLIAALAVKLCHEAGIPPEALQLIPGGSEVGAMLTAHPTVAGVAFTGSTATARAINRTLAAREGPIATLIAETGGQNAMIVDSSALPEQVVRDVLASSGIVLATFSGHDHAPKPPFTVGAGPMAPDLLMFTHSAMVEGPHATSNAYSVVTVFDNCTVAIDGFGNTTSLVHGAAPGCTMAA